VLLLTWLTKRVAKSRFAVRLLARRIERVTAVILLLWIAQPAPIPAQAQSDARTAEPVHFAVIGTDYAFLHLPATLGAGPTLFSFENRGTKRHEMSIALLRAGVTADSLIARGSLMTVSSRAVSDSLIGLLVARPGEWAGGQLYAVLLPGRTYVVVCTLRDTPDALPHAVLGMVGTFRVP